MCVVRIKDRQKRETEERKKRLQPIDVIPYILVQREMLRGMRAVARLAPSVNFSRCAFSTNVLATPGGAPSSSSIAGSSSSSASKITRSIVHHPYSLTDTPLTPGPSSTQDMFAVVEFSGTQYKVVLDDLVVADRIEGVDIGDKLSLPVLLVGSRRCTVVGRPLVEGASVLCEVEELAKDKKVVTLKTRRRKNSKSLVGFRRQVTILRVLDIALSPEDKEVL